MTRRKIISIAIAVGTIFLLAGVALYCNRHMDRYLTSYINHALEGNDSLSVKVGDVRVLLMAGEAWVNNVSIRQQGKGDDTSTLQVRIKRIRVDGLDYIDLLRTPRQHINSLKLRGIDIVSADTAGHENIHIANADLRLNDILYVPDSLIAVQTILAEARRITFFDDESHTTPSNEPSLMPQQILMQLGTPIRVDSVDVHIRDLDCTIRLTDRNEGMISLSPIHLIATNLSNQPQSIISTRITGRMDKGKMDIRSTWTLNPNCDWTMDVSIRDAEFSSLNDFLHPVLAITTKGHIRQLNANYSGNSHKASGEFMMRYDGLDVKTDKKIDSAFEMVDKMGKLVDTFVAICIPKSNPVIEDKAPNKYRVQAGRNDNQSAILFLTDPITDGFVKTLFPGLNLRSKIRKNKK